jgi:hypothetical protein
MQRFAQDYETKYGATRHVPRLLTHFDFPAAHWKHIPSTNLIESTFATVKLRTRVTKGGWLTDCRADDGVQTTPGRARNLAPMGCARPASCFTMVSKWNDRSGGQSRRARVTVLELLEAKRFVMLIHRRFFKGSTRILNLPVTREGDTF